MQKKFARNAFILLLAAMLVGATDAPRIADSGISARPVSSARADRKRAQRSARRWATYRVRRGDTLSRIARKFRTTVSALRRWNGLKQGSVLLAGKQLRVPASRGRGVQRKRAPRVRRYFEKHNWVKTAGATRVLIPYDYNKPKFRSRAWKQGPLNVYLAARNFARGEAALLRIQPLKKDALKGATLSVSFEGRAVPLSGNEAGYRSLMAISGYRKARAEDLVVRVNQGGQTKVYSFKVNIQPTNFPLAIWKRYLGNYDKPRKEPTEEQKRRWRENQRKQAELIKASNIKKEAVFKLRTDDQFDGNLAHPRGHHKVTSKFFTKRKITSYYIKDKKKHWKKPYSYRHRGLDLHGKIGAPVYAMASGTVVIARLMFYEGNHIVIDHGNGVFTSYMHHSKILVREGQRVKAGDLIGRVGATGRVTGPHLHAALFIRGIPVHPMSLLALPIR